MFRARERDLHNTIETLTRETHDATQQREALNKTLLTQQDVVSFIFSSLI